MIRARPNVREVTRHVTELPSEFEVQRVGDHWLVVGPTGIFAIGRSEGDIARDAERTSVLAHDLRSALSDRMPWVPFVDSLLVVADDHIRHASVAQLACTVVTPDMLPLALTTGASVVNPDDLAELYHHLPLVVRSLPGERRTLDPA